MSGVGERMEGDLEDGEISESSSGTEMGTAAAAQARPQVPPAFSGQSFHDRAAAQHSAAAYRSTGRTVETSESDPDSSDEEANVGRRKRHKVSNVPQRPACTTRSQPTRMPVPGAPGGRKVNNIWGSVVQEQCQDAVAAELSIFGVDGNVSMSSRNVETYNFVLARKMKEKERKQERQANNDGEVSMLDAQLEDYMKDRDSEERAGADAKRKRPAKERLGPRAEMDIKGRYVITEDDPEDKLTEEIAHRLQEPKKDLIERIVQVIGNKKAIELLGETAALEESGGVYTLDGSRRRTPGGVYFNLLKNTPSISRSQLRKIFFEEQERALKSKKCAQKRRRCLAAKKMKQAIGTLNLQEQDDVSRETFASDTNEALESLEDAADDNEEEEGQEEAAVGTEKTAAVVYNSADLEVFCGMPAV